MERGRTMVMVVTNEADFRARATELLEVFARKNSDNPAMIHARAVESFGLMGLSFYIEEYCHLLCSWANIKEPITMRAIKSAIE